MILTIEERSIANSEGWDLVGHSLRPVMSKHQEHRSLIAIMAHIIREARSGSELHTKALQAYAIQPYEIEVLRADYNLQFRYSKGWLVEVVGVDGDRLKELAGDDPLMAKVVRILTVNKLRGC